MKSYTLEYLAHYAVKRREWKLAADLFASAELASDGFKARERLTMLHMDCLKYTGVRL